MGFIDRFVTAKQRRRAADALTRVLTVVTPVAKVVAEATSVLVTLQKPSVLGVTNAIANGVRELHAVVDPDNGAPAWSVSSYASGGLVLQGLRQLGGRVGESNAAGTTPVVFDDARIQVFKSGMSFMTDQAHYIAGRELVRRGLDLVLPPVIVVKSERVDGGAVDRSVLPASLTTLTPPATVAVLERTLAMIGTGNRVIMLEGRPGIGKTTMAQAIARDAGLGRVLLFDASSLSHNLNVEMLEQLSVGVVIVDDIDKVSVALSSFEKLRAACRLMIVTANNGSYDDVIDAALARPARIDEVFQVEATQPVQRAPFDQLDTATWLEVSEWPQAYVNELEKRLRAGVDLRLEDLRQRMTRRTRSAVGLMPVTNALDAMTDTYGE